MQKLEKPDAEGAVCAVKGYRFSFISALGYLGVFFSALILLITTDNGKKQFKLVAIICAATLFTLALVLIICDKTAGYRLKHRDCVLLFADGMTVYADKPSKGYIHFSFDEIADYGFIHIVEGSGSGETRPIFRTKTHSAGTYLACRLKNYGYMRITDKDGGYYNVPVGDIETVENYLKEHTDAERFVYQRIAGIDDDIIIPLN